MSSWIQAANPPRSKVTVATPTTSARSIGSASGAGASGTRAVFSQASPTTAKNAGPQAMSSGSASSGAASETRAAQTWNGTAPNRIATPMAIAR